MLTEIILGGSGLIITVSWVILLYYKGKVATLSKRNAALKNEVAGLRLKVKHDGAVTKEVKTRKKQSKKRVAKKVQDAEDTEFNRFY